MTLRPRRGTVGTALLAAIAIAVLAVPSMLDPAHAMRASVSALLGGLALAAGIAWGRSRNDAAAEAPAPEAGESGPPVLALLDAATEVAIVATDREGRIQLFNAGAERLVGRSRPEALGRAAWLDWLDPAEIEARRAEMAAETGRDVAPLETLFAPAFRGMAREWTLVRPNGERRSICLVTTAIVDARGVERGLLTLAHDATLRRESERVLREAMRVAESANEAKTRFLANTSHEIRTPMNAVLGLVYLLAHTRLDDEQRELVLKIDAASKSLLGLLSDILDLGKLEAGELILEHAPFDLHRVVRERTGAQLADASAKGVGLEVRIDPGVPTAVEGDPGRVGQIVANLVSNAVKFTEEGRVIVELACGPERESERARGVAISICVRDTGMGMPPETLARLFTPFAQADDSTTRRHGGSGLGLTIVQRLARLMDGEVSIDSEPGLGTEVRVVLHLERGVAASATAPTAELPVAAGKALEGLTILVADDSATNRIVADRVLRLHGAEVRLAENGLQALEQLRLGPHVDAVLMDVHMPVVDGPEATFVARTELGMEPDVLPIIALTAGTLSSERERALGAGMNDFLTKPIVPEILIATLLRHVRGPAAQGPRAPETSPLEVPSRSGVREITGIDIADLRARLGEDPALWLVLLGHFREETRGIAWPARELDVAGLEAHRAAMHRLKGSAATVGALEVASRAAEIERACKAGDQERVRALSAELREHLDAIRSAIDRAGEEDPASSATDPAARSAA